MIEEDLTGAYGVAKVTKALDLNGHQPNEASHQYG